jgi:hypothetical protein
MSAIWWSLQDKFMNKQTGFCGVSDIWSQYYPEQTTISTNSDPILYCLSNKNVLLEKFSEF